MSFCAVEAGETADSRTGTGAALEREPHHEGI